MRRALFLVPGVLTVAACAAIAGLEDHQPYPAEGGPPPDGNVVAETGPTDDSSALDATPPPDGSVPETAAPPADASDAGTDEQPPPTTFSSLRDPTKWQFFDLAPLPKTMGYAGGAFDGHFVYFASNAPSLLRFDTSVPFESETSWLLATSPSIPATNDGVVLLGNYLYVSPTVGYAVGRYDTSRPFDADAGSFGAHEPPSVGGFLFQGGCTDGKRVYFAPLEYYAPPTVAYEGTVLVYDPAGAGFFTDNSWTVQNIATFNASATGLANCIFDGQYVYFGDFVNGVVARYDPTQPVSSSSAWVFFQTTQVAANLYGYLGLVFTGRYIVFAPWHNAGGFVSTALAYDTQAKFGELTSWTPFDLAATDAGASAVVGYAGGQFDGKYVYFAPHQSGVVVRWDSTQPFNSAASWETFDLTTLHAGAAGFFGTAFDGQYVYFSANTGAAMARFKARDTVGNITPTPSFF
jgi:hypothetical protein